MWFARTCGVLTLPLEIHHIRLLCYLDKEKNPRHIQEDRYNLTLRLNN